MLKGIFGELGGMVSSITHSIVATGMDILEGFGLLKESIPEIIYGEFELAIDQWQDLDTWKNRLETISGDRLIPGGWMHQKDTVLRTKYEYIIQTSYLNPEEEIEKVHMTICSEKRLTQNEILGSDLIPNCADILGVDVEGLDWEIKEGYISA